MDPARGAQWILRRNDIVPQATVIAMLAYDGVMGDEKLLRKRCGVHRTTTARQAGSG